MADNYKSAKYLNTRIQNIIKNGYRPVTDFSFVKQNYNWILKPSGRKNSHLIMTYEEARSQMAKKYPDMPLTVEEYTEQLRDFQDKYSDRLSVYGEMAYQKNYMLSVIDDAEQYMSEIIPNKSRISTEKLKEAFAFARDMSAQAKLHGQASESFYEYLTDYLTNN